ncbi:uncharacterized protein LOC120656895 isoform X2 [Panicum virgatum]|uniref:Survival Motor Neuron Gemin2-binding domain-containing protein n=2 Tax=Panicum virgatum TaxID=38727 RepID=A0A8T0X782_PANVG|nr:uncharacterized protein LOC120656895 isoform X2 [Panicum virgatum]KAG2653214.1 hypothetical protein PVAP13_1NG437900 [Panicum virgatum]
MGKGGELWDDSALVDAFDRAVATYKEMHGKSNRTTPCEDEKPAAAATAEVEGPIVAEAEDERQEKDDNCDNTSCGLVETPQLPSEERQAVQQVPLQETDPVKETHVSESKTLSSDATDADGNVSSSQQTWEYNELLRQYYELEEKSRNVLQQLQQTNYWNYQASGYASTTQQQQIPAYSATAPDPHSSTTQSSCCYWNVPLVSVSCCSAGQPSEGSACMPPSGGCSVSLTCDQCPGTSTTYPSLSNFVQPPTKLSPNGDQVAKAAMMTAEETESETGKEESTSMGMNPNLDITGADSDLAVLLNAWYAAGFYTGRYLARQSTKNSKQ